MNWAVAGSCIREGASKSFCIVNRDFLFTWHGFLRVSEPASPCGILDRFKREARLLASFSHPSIVQLHDIVYEPDFIRLIMAYCES
jgi:serine/threonine protein kinase